MPIASGGTAGSSGGNVGACALDHEDCNGNTADGCETDVVNDAANCGRCGNVCPPGPNASPSCSVRGCGLTCFVGFGDCDLQPQNGCEVNLMTDGMNCGACGFVCQNSGNVGCRNGGCFCSLETLSLRTAPPDPCQYLIPAPADGGIWDLFHANVVVTPVIGSPTVPPKVQDAAACDPTKGGWYLDTPVTPARIILCDLTCSAINSSSDTTVALAIGCGLGD